MHFLNVTIDNDGRVIVDTSGMSYEQLLTVVLTVLEGAVEEIVANAKEAEAEIPDIEQQCRDALFDLTNMAFSSTLERIDPEGELHPTLTTQAILEAENRIIEEGRLSEVKQGT